MLTFPAASQATARTSPTRGAVGTRGSPAASASWMRLRVPKRKVTRAGSLTQSRSGERFRILTSAGAYRR